MKKYNEMANDVFRRIEEYNINKQQNRKKLTLTLVPIMCFCLVALFGVGVGLGGLLDIKPMQTQEDALYPGVKDWIGPGEEDKSQSGTDGRENAPQTEPFIYLCSLKSDGNIKSDLIEPFQTYDSKIYFDFTSIKGLTETQVEQKITEWENNIKKTLSQNETFRNGYHYGTAVLRDEGYIVSRAALNFFTLNIDVNTVKQIKVTNRSEYGQIDVFSTKENTENYRFPHGKSVTIEKERITENICFSWNYDNINKYLKETSNPSYKDLNDSFLFTIDFLDGTQKTAVVNIEFNELGEASIICEGYKSIVV